MDWVMAHYVLPENSKMWSYLLSMDSILRITESVGTQRALVTPVYQQCSFFNATKLVSVVLFRRKI